MTRSIPLRYLPRHLSLKDKKIQKNMLLRSRSLYKKGLFYTRKKVGTYKSKPAKHVSLAKEIYKVKTIGATDELAKKTGCTRESLGKIIQKGEGAYFSSGSRPNQTGQSWGIARLASSITSGKAAVVDYSILEKGCSKKSKALKYAKLAIKKYGNRTRKVQKVRL
jgi:hypothetical protein